MNCGDQTPQLDQVITSSITEQGFRTWSSVTHSLYTFLLSGEGAKTWSVCGFPRCRMGNTDIKHGNTNRVDLPGQRYRHPHGTSGGSVDVLAGLSGCCLPLLAGSRPIRGLQFRGRICCLRPRRIRFRGRIHQVRLGWKVFDLGFWGQVCQKGLRGQVGELWFWRQVGELWFWGQVGELGLLR